jgi:hypothetical protein
VTEISKPISEGHALTDDELDAVSGGFWGTGAVQGLLALAAIGKNCSPLARARGAY